MADNEPMRVNSKKQRQFIETLNRRVYKIEQMVGLLESRVGMLGRGWRDAEFDRFKDRIGRTSRTLKEFVQDGRVLSRELEKSAKLAEEVQRIRED